MLDSDEPTSGCAPGASPGSARAETPQETALRALREAAEKLPADRLEAAIEWVRQAAGRARPVAASGDEVIDDLADLDFDDPMYLILDEEGDADEAR